MYENIFSKNVLQFQAIYVQQLLDVLLFKLEKGQFRFQRLKTLYSIGLTLLRLLQNLC